MRRRLARFHKVAAFADSPTLTRRCIAAAVAGSITFLIVQFALYILLDWGAAAVWFSAFGAAIAVGYAAATLRRGLAVTFGILGAGWLLLELFALFIAAVAGSLG